jgi:WD40 repeat protein
MATLLFVKAKLMLLLVIVGLAVVAAGSLSTIGGEPHFELVLQTGHTDDVWVVALSVDGKHLVTGSSGRTAIWWDMSSGKILQTFHGHTSTVMSVALSGDGKFLVTGSSDHTASLWESSSGKQLNGKKLTR